MPGAPADRESYIDVGEGHLPILARCWLLKSQFDTLPTGVRNGTDAVGFQMSGNTFDKDNIGAGLRNRGINTAREFYLVSTNAVRASIKGDPILECMWATIQQWWMWMPINRSYNLLADDKLSYVGHANSASSPKTYDTIIADITSDLGISAGSLPRIGSNSDGSPQDLIMRQIPGGMALDSLLRPIGIHLVANPFTGGTALQFFFSQIKEDAGERATLDALSAVASYEGDTAAGPSATPSNRCPATVISLFIKWPPPTPFEIYSDVQLEKFHEESNAGGSNAISGTNVKINVGDHYKIENESDKAYSAAENIPGLAVERTTAFINRCSVEHQTYIFGGGYDFIPGKSIRRVRLSVDVDGWYTTVWTHGLFSAQREDMEEKFNRMTPAIFPEQGENVDSNTSPRDDGRIDIYHRTKSWWGKVTDPGSAGDEYTIARMEGDHAGDLTEATPAFDTDGKAKEVNDVKNVPLDTIVRVIETEVVPDTEPDPGSLWHFAFGGAKDFFAEITDDPGSIGSPRSWKELEPDGLGGFNDVSPPVTGIDNAFEVNGWSSHVVLGQVVLMRDNGTDPETFNFDMNFGNEVPTANRTNQQGQTGDAPDTANRWDRDNQLSTTPTSGFKGTYVSRLKLVTSSQGNPILFQYLRDFSVESAGHWEIADDEARLVVDQLEECDEQSGAGASPSFLGSSMDGSNNQLAVATQRYVSTQPLSPMGSSL